MSIGDVYCLIDEIELYQWVQKCKGVRLARNGTIYNLNDLHIECEDDYLIFYSTDGKILWMFVKELTKKFNIYIIDDLFRCEILIGTESLKIEIY